MTTSNSQRSFLDIPFQVRIKIYILAGVVRPCSLNFNHISAMMGTNITNFSPLADPTQPCETRSSIYASLIRSGRDFFDISSFRDPHAQGQECFCLKFQLNCFSSRVPYMKMCCLLHWKGINSPFMPQIVQQVLCLCKPWMAVAFQC